MSEDAGIPDVEIVDGELTVVAEVQSVPPVPVVSRALATAQASAAAGAGFLAGAATLALVQRLVGRRLRGEGPLLGPRREIGGLPVVSSRTYVVDVHLLARRDPR